MFVPVVLLFMVNAEYTLPGFPLSVVLYCVIFVFPPKTIQLAVSPSQASLAANLLSNSFFAYHSDGQLPSPMTEGCVFLSFLLLIFCVLFLRQMFFV